MCPLQLLTLNCCRIRIVVGVVTAHLDDGALSFFVVILRRRRVVIPECAKMSRVLFKTRWFFFRPTGELFEVCFQGGKLFAEV